MSARHEASRRGLIDQLRQRGVNDLAVLQAFDLTPRHLFLPDSVRHRAYQDAPVPIGMGQTASQPSLQALSLQLLEIEPADKVLEVGTGSGFQTALLARLANRVYSVERLRELSLRARRVLDQLKISNVALLVGDGSIGWRKYSPFDEIIVAAAAPDVPAALTGQLAPGGRMLIPVGSLEMQEMVMVRKDRDGSLEQERVLSCTFVPLLGRFAWADQAGLD
ncbi:MAG: protein-L-isoaspartate(D-aspartate) O-methyltransferase [Longimicrobiaceae bacterium]